MIRIAPGAALTLIVAGPASAQILEITFYKGLDVTH
jgi:hypothetical protein